MYQVIYSGDEAGLYHNSKLVAGWWLLWKSGYDVIRTMHWSQKSLARVAKELS